eukprot:TRINITY_DN7649_c0_g1_i2.p1 TRINITY_DN7649_c0_g1~~TRINITY_DN7649_c0_g1_i2.p1  ORF type:complete len:1873 (+),score=505.77 TRINITY_DN7649_c0_g1_i2:264-5621(+)
MGKDFVFSLKATVGSREFFFNAESVDDRENWIRCIQSHGVSLITLSSIAQSAASSHAVVPSTKRGSLGENIKRSSLGEMVKNEPISPVVTPKEDVLQHQFASSSKRLQCQACGGKVSVGSAGYQCKHCPCFVHKKCIAKVGLPCLRESDPLPDKFRSGSVVESPPTNLSPERPRGMTWDPTSGQAPPPLPATPRALLSKTKSIRLSKERTAQLLGNPSPTPGEAPTTVQTLFETTQHKDILLTPALPPPLPEVALPALPTKTVEAPAKESTLSKETLEQRRQRKAAFLSRVPKLELPTSTGRRMSSVSTRDFSESPRMMNTTRLPAAEKIKLKRRGSLEHIFDIAKNKSETEKQEWERFLASIPKSQRVATTQVKKDHHTEAAGRKIIEAMKSTRNLTHSKQEAPVTEVGPSAEAPPPPPPPPQKPPERVNMLSYNNSDLDYYEMFGECESPGLHIWRIENKRPAALERIDYGVFYTMDVYIVLFGNTTCLTSSEKGYHIHLWIGAGATADKYVVGAIRAVELNAMLENKGIQHREEEDQESEMFLGYFPYGVATMEGGTESNFRNYGTTPITVSHLPEYKPPRLYCVQWDNRDKKSINVVLVECKRSSLTQSDAFLLDCGTALFAWRGKLAETLLGYLALQTATSINLTQRNAEAKLYDLTTDTGARLVEGQDLFWEVLGGDQDISEATSEIEAGSNLIRVGVNPHTKKMELTALPETDEEPPVKPKKEWLSGTQGAYVVDSFAEIYVWLGKGVSRQQKKVALECGKYLLSQDRPDYAYIHQELQGAETPLFKLKFQTWIEPPPVSSRPTLRGHNVAPPTQEQAFDVHTLLAAPSVETVTTVSEDGIRGTFEVYVIDKIVGPTFTKLEEAEKGHFFSYDAYMVLHTYTDAQGNNLYDTYFWEGGNASSKWFASWGAGWFPNLHKKLVESGNIPPTKTRVFERKEPASFLRLFNNAIVVHNQRRREALKNPVKKELFDIKVSSESISSCAIQVDLASSQLNSRRAFVLLTPNCTWVWQGALFDGNDIPALNKSVAYFENRDALLRISEGQEPPQFWQDLGAKMEYMDEPFYQQYSVPARLFRCSAASGKATTEEVLHFTQSDINSTDIFIMDAWKQLYLLQGKDTTDSERKKAHHTLTEYHHIIEKTRGPVPIVDITDLPFEPAEFTRHFHAWIIRETKLDPRQRTFLRALERQREEAQAALKQQQDNQQLESNQASLIPQPDIAPLTEMTTIEEAEEIKHRVSAPLHIQEVAVDSPEVPRNSGSVQSTSHPAQDSDSQDTEIKTIEDIQEMREQAPLPLLIQEVDIPATPPTDRLDFQPETSSPTEMTTIEEAEEIKHRVSAPLHIQEVAVDSPGVPRNRAESDEGMSSPDGEPIKDNFSTTDQSQDPIQETEEMSQPTAEDPTGGDPLPQHPLSQDILGEIDPDTADKTDTVLQQHPHPIETVQPEEANLLKEAQEPQDKKEAQDEVTATEEPVGEEKGESEVQAETQAVEEVKTEEQVQREAEEAQEKEKERQAQEEKEAAKEEKIESEVTELRESVPNLPSDSEDSEPDLPDLPPPPPSEVPSLDQLMVEEPLSMDAGPPDAESGIPLPDASPRLENRDAFLQRMETDFQLPSEEGENLWNNLVTPVHNLLTGVVFEAAPSSINEDTATKEIQEQLRTAIEASIHVKEVIPMPPQDDDSEAEEPPPLPEEDLEESPGPQLKNLKSKSAHQPSQKEIAPPVRSLSSSYLLLSPDQIQAFKDAQREKYEKQQEENQRSPAKVVPPVVSPPTKSQKKKNRKKRK